MQRTILKHPEELSVSPPGEEQVSPPTCKRTSLRVCLLGRACTVPVCVRACTLCHTGSQCIHLSCKYWLRSLGHKNGCKFTQVREALLVSVSRAVLHICCVHMRTQGCLCTALLLQWRCTLAGTDPPSCCYRRRCLQSYLNLVR